MHHIWIISVCSTLHLLKVPRAFRRIRAAKNQRNHRFIDLINNELYQHLLVLSPGFSMVLKRKMNEEHEGFTLETNISPTKALLKMIFRFLKVGYVSSMEGISR